MRAVTMLAGLALAAAGCAPEIGSDPVPAAMQWDPLPPRVPSPSGLIVNPVTHRIDFSLAGVQVPSSCDAQTDMPEAACELDQWLQTLDGYPTTSPAIAPASAALDPASLTLGANVVALTGAGAPAGVAVGFDASSDFLTIAPAAPWALGTWYWFAVRGYDGGVRTAAGTEVVGSPTMSLLKWNDPLDCGVSDPSALDRSCPAYDLLLSQATNSEDAPATARAGVEQLQQAWLAYQTAGAWDLVAAAGIPKAEVAVLWGFPTHTNSVAELSPPALVPAVTAPNTIAVAVHGPIDPASVVPFVVQKQAGTIVLMDLTAVATGDLVGGLPPIDATVAGGAIVITGQSAFPAGHTIGLFFTDGLRDPTGAPLVASPVSMLLTFQGALVDGAGHSYIPGVSDSDAAMLEAGRQQLAPLFDNATLGNLTGVKRGKLVYCFAFPFGSAP
jgi:hypothetical protein